MSEEDHEECQKQLDHLRQEFVRLYEETGLNSVSDEMSYEQRKASEDFWVTYWECRGE